MPDYSSPGTYNVEQMIDGEPVYEGENEILAQIEDLQRKLAELQGDIQDYLNEDDEF